MNKSKKVKEEMTPFLPFVRADDVTGISLPSLSLKGKRRNIMENETRPYTRLPKSRAGGQGQ